MEKDALIKTQVCESSENNQRPKSFSEKFPKMQKNRTLNITNNFAIILPEKNSTGFVKNEKPKDEMRL